jgi:hypothetical protein
MRFRNLANAKPSAISPFDLVAFHVAAAGPAPCARAMVCTKVANVLLVSQPKSHGTSVSLLV